MPLYIMTPAQLTPDNLERWHRDYLEQYEKSTSYIRKIGGKPREKKPLTLSEFKTDLESEKNDNPKMSYGRLAIRMAKEDAWPRSFEQARKATKAIAEKEGKSYSTIDILRLQSTGDFWNSLSAINEKLKKEGVSNSYDRALKISQEYFGSP